MPNPASPEELARLVEEFLEEYTLAPEYQYKTSGADEVRRLVYEQYVEPEGAGVHVEFSVDSDDFDSGEDPEVQALANKAIEAARRSDPRLAKVPIRVSFG
jgi:hypothetical protein